MPETFDDLPVPFRQMAEAALLSAEAVVAADLSVVIPHYRNALRSGILTGVQARVSGDAEAAVQADALAAVAATGLAWAREVIALRDRVRALEAELAILRTEAAGSASLADPPPIDFATIRRGGDRA